jgi:hypothetical protein
MTSHSGGGGVRPSVTIAKNGFSLREPHHSEMVKWRFIYLQQLLHHQSVTEAKPVQPVTLITGTELVFTSNGIKSKYCSRLWNSALYRVGICSGILFYKTVFEQKKCRKLHCYIGIGPIVTLYWTISCCYIGIFLNVGLFLMAANETFRI